MMSKKDFKSGSCCNPTFQSRSSRFFTLQIGRFPYPTGLLPPAFRRGKIRVPIVSLFTAGLLLSQLIVSGQKWGVYNVPGMPFLVARGFRFFF